MSDVSIEQIAKLLHDLLNTPRNRIEEDLAIIAKVEHNQLPPNTKPSQYPPSHIRYVDPRPRPQPKAKKAEGVFALAAEPAPKAKRPPNTSLLNKNVAQLKGISDAALLVARCKHACHETVVASGRGPAWNATRVELYTAEKAFNQLVNDYLGGKA